MLCVDGVGQDINGKEAAQVQPKDATSDLGNNARAESLDGMGERMLNRTPPFFQDVKSTFDAFTDAVQQAVEFAGILDFLVFALGRPDMDTCLLYTSPSPRDRTRSRMPSSA